MTDTLKIAVIGAGGVGGFFGGKLAAAGHDVGFVARGAHLAALRANGLVVDSVTGDFTVEQVRAVADPAEIGEVDFVLLAVKTWQLEPVISTLKPLLASHTAVLTTQNGVEAPDQVAAAVGREAVLPGIAKVIAMLDGPGRVRHLGGADSLAFAEWDNRPSERVLKLREALTAAGVNVVVPEDIWAELWAKLLFVVSFGGLGAVTDADFGTLRSRPGTRRILGEAMTEIRDLAAARGVTLPADVVETTLAFADKLPGAGSTSLQRDVVAGLPSELEAWNGAVVRLGEQAGVPTPVHRVLYEVAGLRALTAAAARGE
jgi:2-dehydropantoate 2-reductase